MAKRHELTGLLVNGDLGIKRVIGDRDRLGAGAAAADLVLPGRAPARADAGPRLSPEALADLDAVIGLKALEGTPTCSLAWLVAHGSAQRVKSNPYNVLCTTTFKPLEVHRLPPAAQPGSAVRDCQWLSSAPWLRPAS